MLYLLITAACLLSLLSVSRVAAAPYQKVYVIPVKQGIERGLEAFLERAFREVTEMGADLIILHINTPGGEVNAAANIGKMVRESKVPTVAYIDQQAFSAGTYIALNAGKIIMTRGSSIGAATPIDLQGNAASAKFVSAWSEQVAAAAKLHNRNPEIARAMVEIDREIPGVKEKGKVLSLDAEEASKVGYAEKIVANQAELYAYLGVTAADVYEVQPTVAEKIARFVTSPTVMSLLLIIGLIGIMAELFVPGFGIPGTVGILSFAVYFFGHYVAGFASVLHIGLFVVGILLLIMEIFIPGGIIGMIGFLSIASSLVLAAYDSTQGLASLGIAACVTAIAGFILFKTYGLKKLWNIFVLTEEQQNETGYVAPKDQRELIGQTGQALTPLRPSGVVKIAGKRVDAVSAGGFIAAGTQISVVQVEGARVVVQETEN